MTGGPIFKVPIFDTTNLARFLSRLKSETHSGTFTTAMLKVNTAMAIELQKLERDNLKEAVLNPPQGGGPRPQRGGRNGSALGSALVSDENRAVTPIQFTVNLERFLDRRPTMYWRQLEVGARSEQILHGAFVVQNKRGTMWWFDRPREGVRTAYKFAQFGQPGDAKGYTIRAKVGPAVGYKYIENAVEKVTKDWTATDAVYRHLKAALAGTLLGQQMDRALGVGTQHFPARSAGFRRSYPVTYTQRDLRPTPSRYIEG